MPHNSGGGDWSAESANQEMPRIEGPHQMQGRGKDPSLETQKGHGLADTLIPTC